MSAKRRKVAHEPVDAPKPVAKSVATKEQSPPTSESATIDGVVAQDQQDGRDVTAEAALRTFKDLVRLARDS